MRFKTSVYTCDCYQEYQKYVLVIQKEKIYKITLSQPQYKSYEDKYRKTYQFYKNNMLLTTELENTLIDFLSTLNGSSRNLAALKKDTYFDAKIAARESFNKMFGSQSEAKTSEPPSPSSQASLTPTSRTERAQLVVKAEASASVPASAPVYWVTDKMLPHRTKSHSDLYDADNSEDDEATQPQAMDVDADASVPDSKAMASVASTSASASAAAAASPVAANAAYDLHRRAATNYLTAQKLQLRIPSDVGEAKDFSLKAASAASPVNRTVVFSHRTPSLLSRKRKREEEVAAAETLTPRSAAAKAAGS